MRKTNTSMCSGKQMGDKRERDFKKGGEGEGGGVPKPSAAECGLAGR